MPPKVAAVWPSRPRVNLSELNFLSSFSLIFLQNFGAGEDPASVSDPAELAGVAMASMWLPSEGLLADLNRMGCLF